MANHLKRDRRTRAAFAAIREAADAAGVEVLED
jgi:predicted metallo-beta-lactamase superfamily hydrolase